MSKPSAIYEHFDPYGARPDASVEWAYMKIRQVERGNAIFEEYPHT